MSDERAAQESLVRNWSRYSLDHKTQCVSMTAQGSPSHVELVSCIEIMRDGASIQRANSLLNVSEPRTRQAPSSRRSNNGPRQ